MASYITYLNPPPLNHNLNMSIYLIKNDSELGPLTISEVQALLDAHCVSSNQAIRLSDGTQLTVGSLDGIRFAKPSKTTTLLDQAPITSDSTVAPMASISRDLKNIKKNSSAVSDELTQFMREMRGKSPSEMLGSFAKSTLVRSGITAAFLLFAILVLATAIPFALTDKTTAENSPKIHAPPPPINSISSVSIPSTGAPPTTKQTAEVTPSDPKPVAETLGIGESKTGSPAEPNPFETTDDLLKDL